MAEVGNSSKRHGLAPARRALLEKRLRGGKPQADVKKPAREPGTPLPLTPLQAQIWALAQSHPEVPAYNMRRALRFTGRLDVAALRDAIAVVISRHEALRKVFSVRDGEIVQTAVADIDVGLIVEASDDCIRRAEEALRTPFDLASGPLIRFLLIEKAPLEHLFVVVVHHIVADEWSLDIVLNEINKAYNGEQIPVASPTQYGDYVVRKRQAIARNADTHIEFWRNLLADVDHQLDLPYDQPRPLLQNFAGDFRRIGIEAELLERLTNLAKRLDVTLFVLLYTACMLLLARLSGQTKFAIGVPSANRAGGGAETAVGLFVESLPLPCHVEAENTLSECVQASRELFLNAIDHTDFAFDELLAVLGRDRKRGGNPLFQTMFVLETESLARLHWTGLQAEAVELNGGCAKFDLTLFVDANAVAPTAAIEFDTALFAPDTAGRILGAYVQVLEEIAGNAELKVREIDIVPASMRRQLLTDLGIGPALHSANEGRDRPLPEQIWQVAATMPDAIAAEFGERRLTYRELTDAAGRLATRLRGQGVGNGDLIGVMIGPSLQQLVGILGVQCAGAAYVPLDPAYPSRRLDSILEDLAECVGGGLPVVVSVRDTAERLQRDATLVLVDDDSSSTEPYSNEGIDAASPAYVIYTSGSTGRPKGVVVSHASLAASTAARYQFYDRPERFLLVPSFAFDSSVAGIFWTLGSGGTLVMATSSESRDPVLLGRRLRAAAITQTLMLPSLWQWILLGNRYEGMEALQSVIVAGEACSQELVELHHSIFPRVPLFNEYGPTEATVWASVHRCDADQPVARSVPIGRPIAGSKLYVLDSYGKLAPIGMTGELCIGGPAVSDGYLLRPDETATRFRPDPFEAGTTVYRTGDLVRWGENGALEFVGRVDSQIKLRGYRIEPAEVEARLRASADVLECAVAVVAVEADEDADIQQTIELAERLPVTLVEKLLRQVEAVEKQQ